MFHTRIALQFGRWRGSSASEINTVKITLINTPNQFIIRRLNMNNMLD